MIMRKVNIDFSEDPKDKLIAEQQRLIDLLMENKEWYEVINNFQEQEIQRLRRVNRKLRRCLFMDN